MATTPEGKVKATVSKLLRATPNVYCFMPVPGGYGQSTLDYIGCCNGHFFAIETKRPGGRPTDRQRYIIEAIKRSGGAVFVIDGDLSELRNWLMGKSNALQESK
jgi:hypothetical protein